MPEQELTIEQLAAATGFTVRNIRAHATRGLLPPPLLRGRTGFYGDEHVGRLQLISRLQEQGFNLASITRLVERLPETDFTVGLYQRALGPWLAEPPVEMTIDELAAGFGEQADDARLARLRRAGVIEVLGEGRVRVLNPALIRVGAQGLGLGFDADALLQIVTVLMKHTRAIAAALTDWFLTTHWEPWVAEGRPVDQLPELQRVIEAVQPMAADGVLAAFQQAMSEAVEEAFARAAVAVAGDADEDTAASPATG